MTDSSHALELEMDADQLPEFYPLLQQGVGVAAQVGCPLSEILCGQWGLSAEYVAGRITTIFVNHRPVDDLDCTIIREGATIALSGAMPGLVGATMRRGGYYGAMRGGITHEEGRAGTGRQQAMIRLKLFNLLLPELGTSVLWRGVALSSAELALFLSGKPASFWQGCRGTLLNGAPVDPPVLAAGSFLPANVTVTLKVAFKGMS